MDHRRTVLIGLGGLLAAPAIAQQRPQPARPPARAPQGPPMSPATTPIGNVDVAARQAFMMDFNSDAELLAKNADEPMPPSSMSKLMTAYTVFGLLRAGRLQLTQELPVSERAWRMGGSKMFVQVGTQVKVEDLLRGVIVQSGNDACIVLAEGIAGSDERFAELLNEDARRIGLRNSNFRNSTGWPDPQHRMTCRDLATLAKRIIKDFPEFYRYYSERSFRYGNIDQPNRNPLVQSGRGDGLKTGHTEEAGYGLTGSAERNGRRVILVVNGQPSMRVRSEESERLIEWAFREFENVTLFSAADVVEEAPVFLGSRRTVPLVGGRDLVLTLPRQWRRTATVRVVYDSPMRAPIARGAEVAHLLVSGQGVPEQRVPLYAGADISRLSLPGRALAVVGRVFGG